MLKRLFNLVKGEIKDTAVNTAKESINQQFRFFKIIAIVVIFNISICTVALAIWLLK